MKNCMSGMVKRILSGVLIVAMCFSTYIPAFAASTDGQFGDDVSNGATIEYVDDSSVMVKSSGMIEIVTVSEKDNVRTTTIQNKQTGEKENLIYNINSGTLYSSITNQTIQVDNGEANTPLTRASKSYQTKYVSYEKIRRIVGNVGTAGAIVGAVLALVPGAQGAGSVIRVVGVVMKGAERWVIPNDSKHGLKLTIETKKSYRTRMGRRQVYRIVNTITNVQTY